MKNIYVGNLSFDASEDQVRSLFEAHGAVEKVSIVTDRDTGQPRGFAFVEMTDDDAANKAIEALNGTNLGGRNLNINEARPKTDRPRGGGGGGRGGYGGGGGGGRGRSGRGGSRPWTLRRWWWRLGPSLNALKVDQPRAPAGALFCVPQLRELWANP